jgi:hypothetical protein
MLSAWEAQRKFTAQEAARKAAENQVPAPLVPAAWEAETQAERAGDPDAGKSPAEILRDLQERQVASVITATLPGPEAWGAYERPLPGGVQAHSVQAVKGGDVPLTPGHSAAEGAMDAMNGQDHGEVSEAEQLRRRVQHEVDPVDVPEVDVAELGKRYDQAFGVPSGYPAFRPVHAEQFRTGPATPGRPVPVPTATLNAAALTRPPLGLADGHARPSVPGTS